MNLAQQIQTAVAAELDKRLGLPKGITLAAALGLVTATVSATVAESAPAPTAAAKAPDAKLAAAAKPKRPRKPAPKKKKPSVIEAAPASVRPARGRKPAALNGVAHAPANGTAVVEHAPV